MERMNGKQMVRSVMKTEVVSSRTRGTPRVCVDGWAEESFGG